MDSEKRNVALIIHGFTVLHTNTTGLNAPTEDVVLTPITTAMVITIRRQCKAKMDTKTALSIMAVFDAYILGVSLSKAIISSFPIIGNIANTKSTVFDTELLGWISYLVLKDNGDEKRIQNKVYKMKLIELATNLREEARELLTKLKEIRDHLDYEERKEYDTLIEVLTNKDSTKDLQDFAICGIERMLATRGVTL